MERKTELWETLGCISAATPDPVGDGALDRIGNRLRAHYREVLDEPIPERLSELLDQLEKADEIQISSHCRNRERIVDDSIASSAG